MRIVAPVLGAAPTALGRVALGAAGLLGLIALLRLRLSFHGKLRATLLLGVINSGRRFYCSRWRRGCCRPAIARF